MKEKLETLSQNEIINVKKGLNRMYESYNIALKSMEKLDIKYSEDKHSNIMFSYNQLNNTLDQILNESDQ